MAAPLAVSREPIVVTLKDGTRIDNSVCRTTIVALKVLEKKHLFAFFDLVEKCRDNHFKFSAHQIEDSKKILIEYGFLDKSDKVHEAVKSIVLNAVEEDQVSIKLGDPRLRV